MLLSSEGEARSPALSADGKMIAYIASDAGNVNLYVRRVAGGERIRLTDDSAFKDDPSFSPDGIGSPSPGGALTPHGRRSV